MNKINSLYTFIKEQVKLKSRPLKIIADWDDCLQLTKPVMIYNGGGINLSFEEFFEKYSKMAICAPRPSSSQMMVEDGDNSELAKIINEFEAKKRKLRGIGGGKQNSYKTPDFYDKSPFTSIASELLKSLKENLIKELVIITQYTGEKDDFVRNKEQKWKKTFRQFPQTKVSINSVERIDNPKKAMSEYRLFRPYRHEIIAREQSDFDIYVEDNPQVVVEVIEKFSNQKEKIYVLPDYKSCQGVQGENVYHVKTTISNLTDEDFVKAAEEYKTKQVNKSRTNKLTEPANQVANNEPSSTNYPLWIGLGLGIAVLVGLLIYLSRKKNKKY